MTPRGSTGAGARRQGRNGGGLSAREREIVGMLADGMSGSDIAASLYLSPETVRTHIRNAMAKLGASTRSQAVVLALQRDEIPGEGRNAAVAGEQAHGTRRQRATARQPGRDLDRALGALLDGLCALHEIDSGLIFLAEEDGLTLRRVAVATHNGTQAADVPERVALGEGPLGKVALNRRAALIAGFADDARWGGSVLAAPIVGGGRLIGVLGLTIRSSRPTAQAELLILQVLVNRVGEILASGENIERRLETTVERFGASWYAATG